MWNTQSTHHNDNLKLYVRFQSGPDSEILEIILFLYYFCITAHNLGSNKWTKRQETPINYR